MKSLRPLERAVWTGVSCPRRRLNRDVAIKVSGEQFSERFESEAKAIAALNHPNICQIYDVARIFWSWSTSTGGRSSTVNSRSLPPDEALQLARQIAAALETAHGKGSFIATSNQRTSSRPRTGL